MEVNSNASATSAPKIPSIPPAAELAAAHEENKRLYWDRSHYDSPASQMKALALSSTLYIGNLAFSTGTRHIRSHFSRVGIVKKIVMGLDRHKKTPCGFCFVEYRNREDALLAVAHLTGTKLDGKVIRAELDAGFQPGREFGRGASGGQVRDDRRKSWDPARSKRGREPSSTVTQSTEINNKDPTEEDGDHPAKRQRVE